MILRIDDENIEFELAKNGKYDYILGINIQKYDEDVLIININLLEHEIIQLLDLLTIKKEEEK